MSPRWLLLLPLAACTGPKPDTGESCTPVSWYRDADDDGYGVEADATEACEPPDGYVAAPGDCDDADDGVHPGGTEVCGGGDEDCDGLVDDADPDVTGLVPSFRDGDRDGWGDAAVPAELCTVPDGFVEGSGDCDDGDETVYPGAPEICDGQDNDCDLAADDEDDDVIGAPTWYPDGDGDGYGDPDAALAACVAPKGWIAEGDDCDDGDAEVSPVGVERCDGYDDDCDGLVDDEDAPVEGRTIWHLDADRDGYGIPDAFLVACVAPDGYAGPATDCDDGDAAVNPGATEVCGPADDDCDGLVDDDDDTLDLATATAAFPDDDGDGYGDDAGEAPFCAAPDGWVAGGGDCADDDDARHPDARERCSDGVDDDCDGADRACASLADAPARFEGTYGEDGFGGAVAGAGDFTGDGVGDLVVAASGAQRVAASSPGLATVFAGPAKGTLHPADAVLRLWGDADGDQAGWAVAGGVDLDGDGLAELLVGAPSASFGAGAVAIVPGGATGDLTVSTAGARWAGERPGDGFGSALAFAGDVSGDGAPDLAVGAPDNGGGGTGSGAVYLWFTPPSGTANASTADAKLVGIAADATAGLAVVRAGDLDGDGVDDLAVSDGPDAGGGTVYLVYGPIAGDGSLADAVAWAGSTRSEAGRALAAAGDTDGDGLDDLAVGDALDNGGATAAGAVYVLPGPSDGGGLLSTAPLTLRGEEISAKAGTALAGPGDLDGDGLAELLVGAPGEATAGSKAGAVYVVPGGWTGVHALGDADKVLGATAQDGAGDALATVGDLDGDGLTDWLVGSPARTGGLTAPGTAALWWGAAPE